MNTVFDSLQCSTKNTTVLFTEVDTQGRYGVVKNKYIYKTDKSEKKIIESEKEGGK